MTRVFALYLLYDWDFISTHNEEFKHFRQISFCVFTSSLSRVADIKIVFIQLYFLYRYSLHKFWMKKCQLEKYFQEYIVVKNAYICFLFVDCRFYFSWNITQYCLNIQVDEDDYQFINLKYYFGIDLYTFKLEFN